MIYERNPMRCKFERRLEVNTSPLNIIYNPQAIKKVTEFFYKGRVHTSGTYRNLSLKFFCRCIKVTPKSASTFLSAYLNGASNVCKHVSGEIRFWLSVRAGAEGRRGCKEAVQQAEDADQGRDPTNHRSAPCGRVYCKSDLVDGNMNLKEVLNVSIGLIPLFSFYSIGKQQALDNETGHMCTSSDFP